MLSAEALKAGGGVGGTGKGRNSRKDIPVPEDGGRTETVM